MQHRLRFIGAKGVHCDSQLSYLFLHYFGLDNGSTLVWSSNHLKMLPLSANGFIYLYVKTLKKITHQVFIRLTASNYLVRWRRRKAYANATFWT